MKKETVDEKGLYGGWGVDALTGKQNRKHRDIDIDFDAEFTDELKKY